MQWSACQPFVPPSLLDQLHRMRLRRAALRYAAHGWMVTPGARLVGPRFVCGRPGCLITSCHPTLETWASSAATESTQVRRWWRRSAHTVLLATGGKFDVLEVPATLGQRAVELHALGPHALGPVAVTAAGRWMFFVGPGRPLRAELDHRTDVVRHGLGSWVPAAPSHMPGGPIWWAVPPEQTQWRLPDPDVVQSLLTDALGAAHAATSPRPTVPRQLSTGRRSG